MAYRLNHVGALRYDHARSLQRCEAGEGNGFVFVVLLKKGTTMPRPQEHICRPGDQIDATDTGLPRDLLPAIQMMVDQQHHSVLSYLRSIGRLCDADELRQIHAVLTVRDGEIILIIRFTEELEIETTPDNDAREEARFARRLNRLINRYRRGQIEP